MKHMGYFFGAGLLLISLASAAAAPDKAGDAAAAAPKDAGDTSAAFAAPNVVGDVHFVRKTKGDKDFPPAVFPHWVHRVNFRCYACHNKIVGFVKMKAGSVNITMDAIEEGKYCGACHNGKTAFGVGFETCGRCHRK